MKRYLIVCAMQAEIDGIFLHCKPKDMGNNLYLIEGENFQAYVMKSGIGKVAMAYKLGSFLNDFQVDEIINVGVAGSLSSELKCFDTLIASKAAYSDVDLVSWGLPFGQMQGCPLYFECDKEGIEKALTFPKKKLKTGLILTSDTFVTKENLNTKFYEFFENPVSCDMESAAVGQCAFLANKPFMIIRTISDDTTVEDNTRSYEEQLKESCAMTGEIVYYLISNY